MEPEDVAEYARPEYWDKRYEQEKQYDWFSSVYGQVVDELVKIIQQLHAEIKQDGEPLDILHLGCGNSALCRDLADRCTGVGVPLKQTAVDYSAVVIERMRESDPTVQWLEADVRCMNSLPSHSFDLVIDKGTMDALQADKENPTLDEDIEAMLREVSRVLKRRKGSRSTFVQVTWEIPYYRYHHTKRDEYAWGSHEESLSTFKLGGSDLYRFYRYDVTGQPATTSDSTATGVQLNP